MPNTLMVYDTNQGKRRAPCSLPAQMADMGFGLSRDVAMEMTFTIIKAKKSMKSR